MWHRNNYGSGTGSAAFKPDASFENLFLSQSLHQKFNLKGAERPSADKESAIIKYARLRIANGA
jgi:hypothetical protein